jgi:serine/threonine-protein kinase
MYELVRELVVTVHGVESRGEWQDVVTPVMSGIDGLVYVPHAYGPFPWWQASIPPARRRQVDGLHARLSELQERYPHVHPSVIAHSFGSYLVAAVLDEYPAVTLDRLVLCGSVVTCGYDWAAIKKAGRVDAIRNETCGDDRVVRSFRHSIVRVAMPGSGPSGIDGFSARCGALEQQHFAHFRHSTQLVSPMHCLTYWLPFIRRTRRFRDICRRCLAGRRRRRALADFNAAYGPAIRRAVKIAFPHATARERADYVTVIRHWILEEGRKGTRRFDELLTIHVRALARHAR